MADWASGDMRKGQDIYTHVHRLRSSSVTIVHSKNRTDRAHWSLPDEYRRTNRIYAANGSKSV